MDLTNKQQQQTTSINNTSIYRHCWADFGTLYKVIPWFFLTLLLLGSLSNSLTLRDLWKSRRTPTDILTFNMATSDLLLCISFVFRAIYYRNCTNWSWGDVWCQLSLQMTVTVFYINIYCNMLLLLWTSVTRYATVVRPPPAFLAPFTTTRGCWALCITTWVAVVMVVCASKVPSILVRESSGSCCTEPMQMNTFSSIAHILGVVVFFIALALILVSYGGLVLHLQKVRRALQDHTRVSVPITEGVTEGPRTVCGEVKEGGGQYKREGPKFGSLKVRRKILATVVVFVVCFLPYHIQRAVALLTPQESDCGILRIQWKVKNATIAIASLSCISHSLLFLALRRLSCCQGRPREKGEAALRCGAHEDANNANGFPVTHIVSECHAGGQ